MITAPHRARRQPVIVTYDATRQVPSRSVVQLMNTAPSSGSAHLLLLRGVG